ncbi:hypothetical protein PT277_09060 [Acetobacteraceae bacterium ESL0709]|nr:hypothetical protein [Acetobacteraceae bacterium ESL0697]MDF7678831.1 hypothetical protein [Acetobacteraceae bacterium ESL0709]
MLRTLYGLLAATTLLITIPALAEPGGCLKYGAVGAVGGHLANKHGVLGAVGGCATGMYQRHKYRKSLKEKAALWDQEHPVDENGHKSWWQSHNTKEAVSQKAQWYDQEHPDDGNPAAGK